MQDYSDSEYDNYDSYDNYVNYDNYDSYDNYDNYDQYQCYDTYNDIDMSYDTSKMDYVEQEEIDDDEMSFRVARKIAKKLGEE
jgi:hypothetical protein